MEAISSTGSAKGPSEIHDASQDQTKGEDTRQSTSDRPSPWLLLLGCFFLVFSTGGILNSFGAYHAYYATAILNTHSASSISWIGTIQAFALEIVGVFVGPIFDRGYSRTLVCCGSFLVVFGMMMLSLCTAYWQALLAQAICVGVGMGSLFVPSFAIAASAFEKKRSLAISVVSSAACAGGVIYPITFRQLQPKLGFAWTTRIMAFIALGTFCIALIALRSHKISSRKPRSLIDTQAFHEAPFMIYVLALFVIYAGYFVPLFYIIEYASEHLHTSSDLAFNLLAVTNASGFVGRLLPGLFPKPFAAIETFVFATAVSGISVFAWMAVHNLAGFIVFCVAYGLLSGIVFTITTAMVPLLIPKGMPGVIGTRLGMAYAGCGFGILIGSPVAGAVSNTREGDFVGAQAFAGTTLVLGAALLVYPWMTVKRNRE